MSKVWKKEGYINPKLSDAAAAGLESRVGAIATTDLEPKAVKSLSLEFGMVYIYTYMKCSFLGVFIV